MKKDKKADTAKTADDVLSIGCNDEGASLKPKKKKSKHKNKDKDSVFEEQIVKILNECKTKSCGQESDDIISKKHSKDKDATKKRKRKISEQHVEEHLETISNVSAKKSKLQNETSNDLAIERKNKKKKKAPKTPEKDEDENGQLVKVTENDKSESNGDETSSKKKKRKHHKSAEDETKTSEEVDDSVKEKVVHKKKKKKHSESTTDENFNENADTVVAVKTNKKKKRKENEMKEEFIDDAVLTNEHHEKNTINNVAEIVDTKTKKYKHNEKHKNSNIQSFNNNENDAFVDINNSYNEDAYQSDLIMNVSCEPVYDETNTWYNQNNSFDGSRHNQYNRFNGYQRKSFRLYYNEEASQSDLIMNVSCEPVYNETNTTRYNQNNSFDGSTHNQYNRFNGYQQKSFRSYVRNYNIKTQNIVHREKVEELFVGTPPVDAPSIKTEEGTVLRLNEAQFGPSPPWLRKRDQVEITAKKSYKHLIKGDILVMFKNANLHEIKGYAVKKKE